MSPAETGKLRRKAGRREKPLPEDGQPRTVLAAQLRELKSACGSPTYDELARLSHVYKTGLLDAAGATRLPRWYVIEGYVEGCWKYYESRFGTPFTGAGDLSRWHQLYRDAGGTMPDESQQQETGENDESDEPDKRRGPQFVPATGYAPAMAAKPLRSRQAWVRGGRGYPVHIVAAVVAAAVLLIAAAVVVVIAAWPTRSATVSPWTRLAVQPLSGGARHPLAAIAIPAASLQPELAQMLGGRIAAGGSVTGYQLRNAYPASVPLCLTAVTTGMTAGHDGGGVKAAPCVPSARSQIWIPVPYESGGSGDVWLASYQYPAKCLNADNRGGGVHQGSRVQLWDCYPPRNGNVAHFAESWDWSTWLHAMKSGATSYPLFLGAGNYSLDADDKSLQSGLLEAPLSTIDHYTVSWEYWY